LTPLAAGGLVEIMVGATLFTPAGPDAWTAVIPVTVGLLAAFVGYGRWRLAPHGSASRMPRRAHTQPLRSAGALG
jgi:hypothetical protein